MICCVPYLVAFVNALTTTIPYPAGLKTIYGSYPHIQVLYYDADAGEYVVATPLEESRVAFTGSSIEISHGGVQSGIIKIT